jgi:hypothetical protein
MRFGQWGAVQHVQRSRSHITDVALENIQRQHSCSAVEYSTHYKELKDDSHSGYRLLLVFIEHIHDIMYAGLIDPI